MLSSAVIDKLCKIEPKKICGAIVLSNYILSTANYEISNLELNQILWFIEIEHIKKFSEPLIIENFEILPNYKNIIIKKIYKEFRNYGANSITDFFKQNDIDLYLEQIELIDEVIYNYKKISYFKSCEIISEMLESMNYSEGEISKSDEIIHFKNND